MIAYMFCINSMIRGYHEYQTIRDNPLADGDLLCEREITKSTGHGYQVVIDGIPAARFWAHA